MPRFVVNPTCSIKHKGKIYNEGDKIDLSAEEAVGLHITPVAQAQQQAPGGDAGKKDDGGDKDKK